MIVKAVSIKIGERYFYRYNGKSFQTAHSIWGAKLFKLNDPGDQQHYRQILTELKLKGKTHKSLYLTLNIHEQ